MPDTIAPIEFFVQGEPKAQPRPKAFARKFGDKWMARAYDPGTAEHWKSLIALAAKPHMPATPLSGAVALELFFLFRRPQSHFRGKAKQLRHDAPNFHASKPDCDNLAKAVCDALTTLGAWEDDKQISKLNVTKKYGSESIQGVNIRITGLAEQ